MTQDQIQEIAALQDELIAKGGATKGRPLKDADPLKVERLRELLEEQRAEENKPLEGSSEETDAAIKEEVGEKPKKKKKITMAKPPIATKETGRDKIALEREIRKYVRKDGGFRADMSKEAIAEGNRLLKIAGRKKVEWDTSIPVPGIR